MTKPSREAPELQAACIRMMRALARRAGNGELEALEALAFLQASVQLQLGAAVAGYREGPAEASWTTIGGILGMTRQSAHERFKDATVAPANLAATAATATIRTWTGTRPRCHDCGELRSDAESKQCEQCKREGR